MVRVDDIYALTDFQRHAKEHVARLQQTGRPEILIVNGEAALVVQDAAAYQKLLDRIDRIEAIAGIRQGLEAMHRREGRPAADVFQGLRTKHHIPHDACSTASSSSPMRKPS